MSEQPAQRAWVKWLKRGIAGLGAIFMTLVIFLVLPLLQTIGSPPPKDLSIRNVDFANTPPPPPPPPEEEKPEEEQPEPPPQLAEQAPPLDLSQLELALNPGIGEGIGDFEVKIVSQLGGGGGSEELDKIFSLAELDQSPRAILRSPPAYPPELYRAKRQGSVSVLFVVDQRGRVVNPRVESSTDPAFEKAALEAVKQWRFEPGTRGGEKVQFKMRAPITFNPN